MIKIDSVVESPMQSVLNPKSSCSVTPIESARSNGSHVGKNKVFVPFLKFPEDINVDPTE